MTSPLAALTGGTGFLGRHAVAALLAAGWRVRLLARRAPAHPQLAGLPFETVPGDLADPDALARLVRGADAVVHAAGLVKARGAAEFMAANRDGSGRLGAAVAAHAPAARCVLVSSQAAREPSLSAYAASKRAGEAAAVAALGGAPWVVLRPCVIYGPWDVDGLSLLRLARLPLTPVPTAPAPRLGMIHVADAAAAIAALCREGPAGATFEITDVRTEGHPWRDILRLTGAALGRAPRFVPVPDALLLAAGAANDALAALGLPRTIFGHGKAREILHRDWGSTPGAQPPRALWSPRIELAAGLRETVAWWRAGAG
ncbi:NAD(P)-dependent oxidoreductase [Roseomonas sp. NAR14]|uniref:NAD(P)-dependent oxidoreductase n=1 Tax=Roseomonas acroporae TaxID=2937791 RepID=A0A9X2BWI8_9PROT|nr:NAD(P)-dependent oxidoreductase [Roseomonas acroporae]MCK8783930.1 NAD(P)-dependent oxidoreductase [Roseomonas acroporae]